MKKATAIAPANIAFIKYWGKADPILNIPLNDSLSMNLSSALTKTTVEFSAELKQDAVVLNNKELSHKELKKVSKHLDLLRQRANSQLFALVQTTNSFPTGAGIASSASGFAALTLAACTALELKLSEKELSALARRGSGSASRSIPNGFTYWHKGSSDENSYATSLFDENYWRIHDIVAVVSSKKKNFVSSYGHELAPTSPLFPGRIESLPQTISEITTALKNKNFKAFGALLEQEALSMHAVMMTSQPSILYWLPETLEVMHAVQEMRTQGVAAYFTIDAGPNVHVICEEKNAVAVMNSLQKLDCVENYIDNIPAQGAFLVK